jgi:hypothetical protein
MNWRVLFSFFTAHLLNWFQLYESCLSTEGFIWSTIFSACVFDVILMKWRWILFADTVSFFSLSLWTNEAQTHSRFQLGGECDDAVHRWSCGCVCVLIQQPVDEESAGTESCRFINISGGRSVDRGEGMMAFALCFAPHPPPPESLLLSEKPGWKWN